MTGVEGTVGGAGAGPHARMRARVLARARDESGRAFEVLGLTGLVVTQPVLSIFEGSPDVFVIRRAEPIDVVVFAVAVAVIPALVLWAVGALIGLWGARPRQVAHVTTLAVLGGLLTLLVAEDLTALATPALVVLAAAGAGVTGWAAWRWANARLLCRYLAAGSVVFVGSFLLLSPVAPLIRSPDVAAAAPGGEDLAPVLMLVFDELPTLSLLDDEGGIDEGRFPALAALAADSTWYRNHSTVAAVTPAAVPAILTGRLPGPGVPPVASTYPDSLFTLLGESHEVRATESLTRLCPASTCAPSVDVASRVVVRSLLGTATDLWRQRISPPNGGTVDFTVSDQWFDPASASRLEAFGPGLAVSTDRPRFDFLHVLMPHQPWRLLPDGSRYEAPDPPPGAPYLSVWDDQHAADVARQRHLLQLQHVDREVGRIMGRLRALGTYDDTLIVVTADHGVAFTVGTATRAVYDANAHEVLWTPFLLKAPGQQRGAVVDTPMQSIDGLPTIAAALGVDVPFATDGAAGGPGDPGDDPDHRQVLDYRFNERRPDDGDHLVIDGRRAFADLLEAPPLGEAGGGTGLYRIGRDADLIGRPLSALSVGDPIDGEVSITTTGAYLSGTVDPGSHRRLALVADGRVVAAPALYEEGTGGPRFFAMIPPQWRVDDPDAVAVHVVEGPTGSPVLRPVRG